MAPAFDERGDTFLFNDQRLMMIELDKFVENCEYYFILSFYFHRMFNYFTSLISFS